MQKKELPLKISSSNNNIQHDSQSESSQWSLKSLEDLKGLTLEDVREDEDNNMQEHIPSVRNHKSQKQKQLTPKYPSKQAITADTVMHTIGAVVQKVGALYIVEADNAQCIVDLNNCLFTQKRECLGFIIDVLGRVQHPYYAIQPFPEDNAQNLIANSGDKVYYAEGSKTLTEQDIKSISGKKFVDCEVQSYSSDEQQKQFSQQPFKKQQKVYRNRRNSFEERPAYRERTRQMKNRRYQNGYRVSTNRPPPQVAVPQNNQQYLNNMYTMYYQQMMQMQNPNYNQKQPNFPPMQQNPNFAPMQQNPNFPPMQQNPNFPPMQQNPNFLPLNHPSFPTMQNNIFQNMRQQPPSQPYHQQMPPK